MEKWVRVFEFEEGVLRFEGFEETETVHQKIIDDGSIIVNAQQQEEHFQNTSAIILANCRQKGGLVSSGSRSGSLVLPPPNDANKSPASSAQAQRVGPVSTAQVDGPRSTIDASGGGDGDEADTEEEEDDPSLASLSLSIGCVDVDDQRTQHSRRHSGEAEVQSESEGKGFREVHC